MPGVCLSGKARLTVVNDGSERSGKIIFRFLGILRRCLKMITRRVDPIKWINGLIGSIFSFSTECNDDATGLTSCTFRESICSLVCWPMANDFSKFCSPFAVCEISPLAACFSSSIRELPSHLSQAKNFSLDIVKRSVLVCSPSLDSLFARLICFSLLPCESLKCISPSRKVVDAIKVSSF